MSIIKYNYTYCDLSISKMFYLQFTNQVFFLMAF